MVSTGAPEVLAKDLAALTNLAPTGALSAVSNDLFTILGRHGYPVEQFLRHFIGNFISEKFLLIIY